MTVEIEKFIREVLGQLPPRHPDRKFLEGQAQVFASFNAGGEIGAETEQPELNPDYLRTVEALEKAGLTIFPIEPKSLAQMLLDKADNPYFSYLNPSDVLRGYIPEAAEVAVNTQQVVILGSNDKNQAQQSKMVTQWGEELKQNTGLTDQDISVRMPHASEACQLDIIYQRQHRGKKLYPNFWVRSLDKTVGPNVASVGRDRPGYGLGVGDWGADGGSPRVWASPVVVILHRKLKIG